MSTMSALEVGQQPYAEDVLAGEGAAAARLRLQISRIAPHFRTALVTGEPGSGKRSVAREMHRLSGAAVARGPFQTMDIAAFAQAQQPVDLQGILYLTGLDCLEPGLQERLVDRLRAIQREVRIIVASECDLRGMLATGRMRQSLAARIGSLEIRVAPLRDRMDDFEATAAAMLLRRAASGWFGMGALAVLKEHSWPGNLQELWSVTGLVAEVPGEITANNLPELRPAASESDTSGARLDKVMQRHVFDVLQRCSGNKLRAAELLGISRSTLYRMLEAAAE